MTTWRSPFFTPLLAFYLATLMVFSVSVIAAESPTIVVKGLFKNKAILVINGNQQLIKVGQRSAEGVLLVSSSSKGAEVDVDGKRFEVSLTRQISRKFTAPKATVVRLPRGKDSHYRAVGTINGYSTEMMVDTGATNVAMNQNEATRLGIDYLKGRKGKSSTAGGVVDSYRVLLNRVSIGNILLYNVQGSVLAGDHPTKILLGNSFLSRLSLRDDGGVLVLTARH